MYPLEVFESPHAVLLLLTGSTGHVYLHVECRNDEAELLHNAFSVLGSRKSKARQQPPGVMENWAAGQGEKPASVESKPSATDRRIEGALRDVIEDLDLAECTLEAAIRHAKMLGRAPSSEHTLVRDCLNRMERIRKTVDRMRFLPFGEKGVKPGPEN